MCSVEMANSRRTLMGSGCQKRSHTCPHPATAVKTANRMAARRRAAPIARPPAIPRAAMRAATARISAVANTVPARDAEAITEAYMAAAMAE